MQALSLSGTHTCRLQQPCRRGQLVHPGAGPDSWRRRRPAVSARGQRERAPGAPAAPPQHAAASEEQPLVAESPQQVPATAASSPQKLPRSRLASSLARRVSGLVPAAVKRWVAEHDDPRLRGLVLLNAMTLLMGSNWVVVKEGGADMDPWLFTALRFLLAAAAFAPFLPKAWHNPRLRDAGLEIGAWSAAGYLLQSLALSYTPASRASLLSTFTVLAVPLLAGLSGAKVKPLVWGCASVALVGTSLLEAGGGAPPNIGDLYSVLSALFFGAQLFRTEQVSRSLQQGQQGTLGLMAISMATVAACSMTGAAAAHWQDAAAAWTGLQQLGAALVAAMDSGSSGAAAAAAAAATGCGDPAHTLGELLYTSLCSTDLALWLEMVALQHVSSTEAAMVYSLEPVSGALMAYAFLGDRWGPTGWVGAALILAASLLTQSQGALEEEEAS